MRSGDRVNSLDDIGRKADGNCFDVEWWSAHARGVGMILRGVKCDGGY
jgi:hypothetical protein